MGDKKVITVLEEGANYIFHILALAKIGYDNDYAEVYKDSLNINDLRYLELNKFLLEFDNGNRGALTSLYIFLSSKLNLDSQDKINEYFNLLVEAIKTKNVNKFYERYKTDIVYLEKMWGQWWEYNAVKSIEVEGSAWEQEAEKIADIIKSNFEKYDEYVWPKEKEKIKMVANEVEVILSKMDIIKDIEKCVGLTYDEESFKILLCSANENGPDANDLGYDKNLHYFGRDKDVIIHFVVHEIIVRILIPIRNKLCSNYEGVDNATIYKALEMLAEFYTTRVLNDGIKMKWYKEFLELYEDEYRKDSSITAEKLLILGFNYKK